MRATLWAHLARGPLELGSEGAALLCGPNRLAGKLSRIWRHFRIWQAGQTGAAGGESIIIAPANLSPLRLQITRPLALGTGRWPFWALVTEH